MSDSPPADTDAAAVAATRRALAEHGYAGLSMAKVAAEFEKSQSLLHYHYDTKEGLLAAFVAHERDRAAEAFAALPEEPAARLDALLTMLLDDPTAGEDDDDATEAVATYADLHALAPQHDAVREELAAFDDLVRETVREALEEYAATGHLAVDPGRAAALVVAAHDSAFVGSLLGTDRELRGAIEAVVLRRPDS